MFDHGWASVVFLLSTMVVYPCDIHKVSRLLTGKKGQLKKEVTSVAMMTNFGFGPDAKKRMKFRYLEFQLKKKKKSEFNSKNQFWPIFRRKSTFSGWPCFMTSL